MTTLKAVLLAAATAMPFGASAMTIDQFSSFWVLGDSLSDSGNLFAATSADPDADPTPTSPPYFEGRFSNGPVWAERVADAFAAQGVPGGNVAFGGAEATPDTFGGSDDTDAIPDLAAQVGLVQQAVGGGAPLGERPLASVWFGANDIFGVFDGSDSGEVVEDALGDIADGFDALAALGFDDLLVFNLPDLGQTPLLFDTISQEPATALTMQFNQGLAQLASDAAQTVTLVDTAGLFDALIADPSAFGVSDVRTPCLIPGEAPCSPQEAAQRAFFDAVHPNATIHAVVADAALGALAPIPLPAGGWLLLGGLAALGGLHTRARRR